jgi:uncharacterized membrane protein YkgB
MITCALAGAIFAIYKVDELINKDYFEKNRIVATGLMIYLAAFIIGAISGLIAGSKITGSFQLLMGAIGSIMAVVTYLGTHKYILKRSIKTSDVLWVAVLGFTVAAIGVTKKDTKKKIITLVLKACGLGTLCGLTDILLF